jgi:hypothetical protein
VPDLPEPWEFLATRCGEIQASCDNLLDLGIAWPIAPGAIPEGEPFVEPRAACPGGGSYSRDGSSLRCSLHGIRAAPVEAAPAPGSPLDRLLESLDAIEVELAVLAEGIRTRVTLSAVPASPRAP